MDILVKPLSGDRFAISFINVAETDKSEEYSVDMALIKKFLGDKVKESSEYKVKDV